MTPFQRSSGSLLFSLARQRDCVGAPLARDHRGTQQKLPGAFRIGGGFAQVVEIALARVRVARLETFFLAIDCSWTNSMATVRRRRSYRSSSRSRSPSRTTR